MKWCECVRLFCLCARVFVCSQTCDWIKTKIDAITRLTEMIQNLNEKKIFNIWNSFVIHDKPKTQQQQQQQNKTDPIRSNTIAKAHMCLLNLLCAFLACYLTRARNLSFARANSLSRASSLYSLSRANTTENRVQCGRFVCRCHCYCCYSVCYYLISNWFAFIVSALTVNWTQSNQNIE